jgi:hypothetical protein
LDECVFILSEKVLKLSITFTLGISPDAAPFSVSKVLRDRRQSESEFVSKVLPFVHCVPAIITSSLFIGFKHTSNDWKWEKVNCKFGIASFQR